MSPFWAGIWVASSFVLGFFTRESLELLYEYIDEGDI